MKKTVVMTLVSIMLLIACTGCFGEPADAKYEESDFSITMPEGFEKKTYQGLTYYYEGKNTIVTVLKESNQLFKDGGYQLDTLDDYMDLVLQANNLSGEKTTAIGGGKYQYFTYERTVQGQDFYYMGVGLKGSDAYWFCNFACETKNKDNFHDKFIKWAESIEVK